MRSILTILVLVASVNVWALPPDAVQLRDERAMMQAVFSHILTPVDRRSCDLKVKTGKLKVADMILSHTLWSVQAPREGVEKKPGFACGEGADALGFRDCHLTSAESIRIPGEPEGWSRTLLFKYNKDKKLVLRKSFKCLDVP